mgnify:CR=1 FL=1
MPEFRCPARRDGDACLRYLPEAGAHHVYSVISTPELKMVLKDLKEVDPAAFINVIKTDQVSGRFYIKPND